MGAIHVGMLHISGAMCMTTAMKVHDGRHHTMARFVHLDVIHRSLKVHGTKVHGARGRGIIEHSGLGVGAIHVGMLHISGATCMTPAMKIHDGRDHTMARFVHLDVIHPSASSFMVQRSMVRGGVG